LSLFILLRGKIALPLSLFLAIFDFAGRGIHAVREANAGRGLLPWPGPVRAA
jgi:hypothetical protein